MAGAASTATFAQLIDVTSSPKAGRSLARRRKTCHDLQIVSGPATLSNTFYDSLPDFGGDDTRHVVAAVQTLHAAIVRLDLPLIEQMTTPLDVHIDHAGQSHSRDAWLAWLKRQPDYQRLASIIVEDVGISHGMAHVIGHLHRRGSGATGERTFRFNQVWTANEGVWRRSLSQIPRIG